ncbi:GNAT family N-acetyltransferase [Spirilliplanes yamanashiensis]|uniref:GCN5 family N-acetyltransferase n=1 Tax=Spirilliplanes yamanashiensis TaxID=42233 RepID=A0A8J4DIZ2_9ACTN|nr:GNAT family N-acetyltransferase [Spirilliplanes yamanashiensis]MDP9815357.1 putative N-acetyltransferase YhbS [Spirilliplanes yamanashiensis]GIJ03612.1 GCN5 family N-acetyltransferase [Spirilliplanes yamanashiensis]
MTVTIRAATAADLPVLQEIEVAAGRCFADVGMPEIAGDEPLPLDVLDHHRRRGLCWVAAGDGNVPVAYLIAERVDGCLHVEQVSVHPGHARRGIGRRLVGVVAGLARTEGAPAVTLTTFTGVPWNGPYYARLGFRAVPDAALPPGLRAIRAAEVARGLDRWPRTAMRLDL